MTTHQPPRSAVIGAGIAGLACAQALQAAGVQVTVFEKSRGPGGRATTKRATVGEQALGFDQGPVCFAAQGGEFTEALQAWAAQGVVADWPAACAALGNTAWVGSPGMNALGKHMAAGLDVQPNQRVVQIVREFAAGQPHPRWHLVWRDETLADHQTEPFDAVVVATPAEQAVSLLAAVSDAAQLAAHIRSEPCWAVMLAFDTATGPAGDWHCPDASTGFATAVRDSAKPGRAASPLERWVLHATPQWTESHLNDSPEAVIAQATKTLRALGALGMSQQPVFQAAHRWKYSQPTNPIRLTHVWQPQRRVGVCGDWLGSASVQGVERAWTSGRALAHSVAASIAASLGATQQGSSSPQP